MRAHVDIRDAATDDAQALADIYNPYVMESTATFDTRPKSAEERREWLVARSAAHPVIVAEEGGTIVGWGALSRYSERPAWAATVEVSVYVDSGRRREGIGRLVLGSLVDRARHLGHHAILARIVAGNQASQVLTRDAGFEHVGTLREVGRKFDRWLDVEYYELIL